MGDPTVVTASEANRSFSSLLRQVAEGQVFTVESHGRPVATLAPAKPLEATYSASRRALFSRLANQPAIGGSQPWQRGELYD